MKEEPAAAPAAKPKADPDGLFLAEMRSRRARLRFELRNGRQIEGVLRSFGRFTLDVETASGRTLLFKHGVDLVEIVPAPPAPGPLRPAIGK